MNELLTVGAMVRHPENNSWGVGQVQSIINGRITVNFENVGKQTLDGDRIDLELID